MNEIGARINKAITSQDPPQIKGLKLYELGYQAAKLGDFRNAEVAFESLIIPPFPDWRSADHKYLAWQVDSRFELRPIFCPNDSVSWTEVDGQERNIKVHNVAFEDYDELPENAKLEQDESGNIVRMNIEDLSDLRRKCNISRAISVLRFPYLESIETSNHLIEFKIIAPKLRRLEIQYFDSWGDLDRIFAPMLSNFSASNEHETADFSALMRYPALEEFSLHLGWGKDMNYDWSGFVTRYGLKKFRISFGHADDIIPVYSADYLLGFVDWVEEIEPYRELISSWSFDIASLRWILDGHPLSKLLFRNVYGLKEAQPRTLPWSHCWSLYNHYLRMIPEQMWLLNKAILYGLNLEEFTGYTGHLTKIIDDLPERYQPIELPLMCELTGQYREYGVAFDIKKKGKKLLKEYHSIRDHFRTNLLELSFAQIQDGGTTLFFDIDKIGKDGLGAKLTAGILERRREEVENTTVLEKEGAFDLSPLWCTHYGFSILRSLGLGLSCNQSEFAQVVQQLKDFGMKIELTSNKDDVAYGCVLPDSIRRIILSRLTPTNWETVEHRLSRLADFKVYPVNPTLFKSRIVKDWSERSPDEFEKWRNIRDTAAEQVNIEYPSEEREGFGISMPEHYRNYSYKEAFLEGDGEVEAPKGRVYVTGKIEGMTKGEVQSFIESKGYEWSSSISGKLSTLILGERPGGSKIEKAKKLGIETVTWDEFVAGL